MPKLRARKDPNAPSNYWPSDIMDAHIDTYNLLEGKAADDYYMAHIYRPLSKMCEIIVNRFQYSYTGVSRKQQQDELLSFLTERLGKYDGRSKSFSFMSVIGKRHMIQINQKGYENNLKHVSVNKGHADDYEDLLTRREVEKALIEPTKNLPAYCDSEFLNELADYWQKEQIENHRFFEAKYDPVVRRFIEIIRNPGYYHVQSGRKDFNKLLTEDPNVFALDQKVPAYSRKTNRKSTKVMKLIRKVNFLAYQYFLEHGTIKDFTTSKAEAFPLVFMGGSFSVTHNYYKNDRRSKKRLSSML